MDQVDPDLVWHYTSVRAFASIARSAAFRLFNIRQSNDSLEGSLAVRIFSGGRGVPSAMTPREAEQIVDMLKRIEANARVYAACFSRLFDDAGQFRMYADNASGVSLGFSEREFYQWDVFGRPRTSERAHLYFRRRDVSYHGGVGVIWNQHRAYLEHFGRTVEQDLSLLDSGRMDNTSFGLAEQISNMYSIKGAGFRNERETRVLALCGQTDCDEFTDFDPTTLKRYVELPYPPLALKQVVLGPACRVLEEDVESLLSNTQAGNRVRVTRSECSLQ